ncbi:MAG: hypothetical protein ABL995_14190 [Bryobacteraceae bacterium]
MVDHHEFHDGLFEGFQVEGAELRVFLRTVDGKGFIACANQLEALAAGGFRPGNIIVEVLVREHTEVTPADIAELYDLPQDPDRGVQIERLLANVNRLQLKIFEINPSHGGMLLALAGALTFETRNTTFKHNLEASS